MFTLASHRTHAVDVCCQRRLQMLLDGQQTVRAFTPRPWDLKRLNRRCSASWHSASRACTCQAARPKASTCHAPFMLRTSSQNKLAPSTKHAVCKAKATAATTQLLSLLQTSDSSNLPYGQSARRSASRQRHAWFNDYTISISLGVANGAAGILSLPFKVTIQTQSD